MYANHESLAFRPVPARNPRQTAGTHEQVPKPEAGGAEPWKESVIRLLKDTLIKELLCVVRYNHLSDGSSVMPLISAEFLLHAYEELAHAHKLALRITQLGGELEYSPALLMRMGQATYDCHHDLKSIIDANLAAEYKTIVTCNEILSQIDAADLASRRLLQDIVDEQRERVKELRAWLVC